MKNENPVFLNYKLFSRDGTVMLEKTFKSAREYRMFLKSSDYTRLLERRNKPINFSLAA